MNDPKAKATFSEEMVNTPVALPKPMSWSRSVRTSKKDAFDEMEDRIKRMESAIITSGLIEGTEPEEETREDKSSDKIESQADLSNHLSNLVIDAEGSPNFIGWASGFSLLSPQGIRWISDKLYDEDDIVRLTQLSKRDYGIWGSGDADLWYPRPRSQHSPLPSKNLASKYVDCFFKTFNNVFPVVHPRVFNSYFERQYTSAPPGGTAWYALLNSVLSLGSIGTKEELEEGSYLIDYTSQSQEPGVEFFRNASSCFHGLLFREANLMAMQALTLMLFITTSSPNPQPSYMMTSVVANLASTLGLHRRSNSSSHDAEEIEQRRNVFWVFYVLEKSTSHSLGRPSSIYDDDIAVDLPPNGAVTIQASTGAKLYDFFQNQTTLSIIESRIYSELYSASSLTKSREDRMRVLGKLDDHLKRWRDAIPIEIRPEHPISCTNEQYIPVVMMHFIYLEAVIQLHRVSSRQDIFRNDHTTEAESGDERLDNRSHTSQLLCLAAARRSIRLLDTIGNKPRHNQHFMWRALYYPLSACLVLLSNIFSDPQDQHAASDIHLMKSITSFLTRFVNPTSSFAATPTVNMFQELYSIAARLVAKAPSYASQSSKRSAENDLAQAELSIVTSEELLYSNLNSQPTEPPAQRDAMTANLQSETKTHKPSSRYNDQQDSQQDQDVQDIQDVRDVQEFLFDDNPLGFAPFIVERASYLNYDPPLSPTSSEWGTPKMWVP
ncbi:hypothetical protein HYFRA_00009420 [Hymenoscyphus fraxineus]|uniref:Xylanolytic transcriptional activator regulatory domain-containing protein n=1 Tax=Hymenoscyphus fraxineus TaxID=746836 RepID=A0A9N9PVZ0_9HELO|nr:hypothetical protein HYFRA_00009420 [Hymenoscyphus fraxineus]